MRNFRIRGAVRGIVIGVICILFLCVGCASSTESGVSGTLDSLEGDGVNQVVIALSEEPEEGFDPCVGWGRYGSPLIQSTLITVDENMEIAYDLATDYTVSSDGKTWTFQIRDDIYYSDGTKLTVEDIAFTFETAKNSGSVVDLSVMESVRTIGDTTVEFTLKESQITFLYTVAQTGIVPEASYDARYYENPIGSGPYTLLQWDKGQQVILGINEYYYGEMPEIEQVTILFMEEDAAYLAAQKGLVDVAITNSNYYNNEIEGMTLQNFETIDNRGLTLPVLPDTGETTAEGYEIGNDVTSDIAIRQALSYGIDREVLIAYCLNGYGTPAYSECDGMPWSNEAAIVEYDSAYAIALLEEAGWVLNESTGIREKDGAEASFTLLYNADDSTRQALSLAVSTEAAKLGIAIEVYGTSWDDIATRMYSDAVLMGWGSQNPIELYYLYHSSNMGVDYYNPENYSSEITDFYIEQAMGATEFETAMEYFQLASWDGETGISTLGACPWVWLVNVDHLYYVADGLDMGEQKIHSHGHSWPVLSNLNEWEWVES